jgi:hypothetical protein
MLTNVLITFRTNNTVDNTVDNNQNSVYREVWL